MKPEQRVQALQGLVEEMEISVSLHDDNACGIWLEEMSEHLQELEKFFNTKVIEHEAE